MIVMFAKEMKKNVEIMRKRGNNKEKIKYVEKKQIKKERKRS